MPKPKSKSNKDSLPSQQETPSSPEQQLLSIKPKRPQQDSLVEAEKNTPQPPEQKLLSIKPKKTEEVSQISETDKQSSSEQEVTQTSETDKQSSSEQEVTQISETRETLAKDSRPQKPSFQKPQLKKPQPPPYKNLEQFTTSSGETFVVGEEVKVTTANYGEYIVAIKFLYEAADGSVWASYSHTNKEQRHPWRWGCCRAELLKKSNE
ncbi:MAG: hypothetical protein IGS39_11420 [Calothrix sp. C42_A2020_038]|nr:hypothetical protein [Calothrix sp. C42_A2020_038]